MLSACGSVVDDAEPRTKNGAVTTTLPPATGPDRTLSAPDGVQFGTRVAIDRAMVFASTRARPASTKGAVYASSFSDEWSTPREVVSSWDFYFGRDIDVNDHDVIATAADTRSGLFGDRIGDILVGTSPQSAIVTTNPRFGLNARTGDDLGAAVALSDNYMAVSAPSVGRWSTPSPIVFVTSLTSPSPTVTSLGPEGFATGETFGTALDMDDSTLVVGASGALSGDGAVFVYTRSGATWTLAQRLDGTNDEAFGSDVNLAGSKMVVGAPGAAQGAIYVCERDAGTWTCPTRLAHPDTSATGLRAFGAAVDLSPSGDALIVGAPWGLGITCCPGAAFTYTLREGAWVLERSLQPASPANDDGFGNSVAIEAGVAVVGAPRAASGAGAVSIFGTPRAGSRAPRANVEFTAPIVGAAVTSNVTFFGDAPTGYDGSMQAWDRDGNSWRSTFDPASRTFGGTWPNANSAYGSLTVFNAFGYETAALSVNIGAPAPTTIAATTAPPVTSPPATSPPNTASSTAAPSALQTTTPATTRAADNTVATPRTTLAPASTTESEPNAASTATSPPNSAARPTSASKPESTTAKTPSGANSPSTVSTSAAQQPTSPFATSLAATCRANQPCTVEVPALLGGKSGSMRGAPAGLRYNPKSATISGAPRKRGTFTITVKGGANGKTGSATVTLTVK